MSRDKDLNSIVDELRKSVADLTRRVVVLENRQHLPSSPSGSLDECCTKLLVRIANCRNGLGRQRTIEEMKMGQAKGDYYFDQLEQLGLIDGPPVYVEGDLSYTATQTGRAYLVQQGLL